MDKTIKTLTEVLKESKKEGTTPYDTTAEVVRIEGKTAWCHIPGGIDETPVSMTIAASVGDTVQVRIAGGRAWITGNASAPPTDDTVARAAHSTAETAEIAAAAATELSEAAKKQAAAAAKIASDTEQHFWFTETGLDTGAHITEVDKDTWDLDPSNGGGNLLARSNGIALRDGLIELATLQQSGMDVNADDGLGNTVNIAHLGYGPGTDSGGGTSDAPYYSLGKRTGAVGNYSVAEGYNTTASGYAAHAEGVTTQASGNPSHAEGSITQASGSFSHAEGEQNTSSGYASHSEGQLTVASGWTSHSEGNATVASGDSSHAQNFGTIADQFCQTAIGKWNTSNNTNNLFAIGNGIGDNGRADAFTVDISGNVVASGDITANGHSTPIGYNNTGSGTKNNFPNNSQQELVGGISVTAGTWLLICRVGFPTNATGRRFACWHNNTTAADYYTSYSTSSAVSGGYTNIQTVMAIQVSGNTTFSVHAFQNSGSAMNVAYNWTIVRIA